MTCLHLYAKNREKGTFNCFYLFSSSVILWDTCACATRGVRARWRVVRECAACVCNGRACRAGVWVQVWYECARVVLRAWVLLARVWCACVRAWYIECARVYACCLMHNYTRWKKKLTYTRFHAWRGTPTPM